MDSSAMRRRCSSVLPLGVALLVATALFVTLPRTSAARAPARAGAATESRLVSQTALGVLARGGTAVDAAVAAALAAGVVAPSSSGLGGGGFALVYRASDRSFTVLDFRETAPAAVDMEALERRPLPEAERGKLVGVPGEARGLAELQRRFGKRPWAELVEPAERFARDGFAVESHLASQIGGADGSRYRRIRSVGRAFWPGGVAAMVGTRVKRPELARTLATLATSGAEALYSGPLAADLVAATRQFGGALSANDLQHYAVRERQPLRFTWEDYEIVTMPPPSGGGLLLAEVLGSFSREELAKLDLKTGLGVHLVAEVMRGALADRARYVGDPDVLPIELSPLFAPARLRARKAEIVPDRTRTVAALAGEDHGTHALVIADRDGNVVSLTTTVNTGFGAEIDGAASGVVLNDELDDFTARAATNALGVRFPPNAARPFVRPTSSMMPTIVLRGGKPVFALGGSGGYSIPTSVTETLLGLLVRGESPEVAVKRPRFRFDSRDYALILDSGYPESLRVDLAGRGETVRSVDALSAVQVLAFTPGGVTGGADPRKGGAALVQ
jgi:gamma-glutamyltranspeptidase/glutathione hydrolase